ncbi:MAG: class I SAM-dependent methyltransferase family protein [Candidatus Bathyarchaeota archaeon]|nr:class I SAM-dependent methyltransferase family protein [Candidatus Bathyarchaeota archaeon]
MRKRLRKTLSSILSSGDLSNVYNSFDVVGDIAIIKLPCASSVEAQTAAKAIMSVHRNVKTVLLQASPVAGELRLRGLTHVAGENKTRTVHREFGCLFSVDVAECYFSPRLSHERMRIARLVKPDETVVNMFAGVGCFSIIIAKHSKVAKVFSIDLNPAAVRFMQENIRLNRVYDKVTPLLGDSKDIINRQLRHVADRVLMPLPEKALAYLPCAVSALKSSGGWIHYHGFEHAAKTESPTEKVKLKVAATLDSLGVAFEVPFVCIVRSTGPNWYQLAADIHVMFSQVK